MTGVRERVKATVGVGMMAAVLAVWLAPHRVAAQQGSPAPPPPALQGDAVHGRYLVERVAMCGECHSTRDDTGTIIPATRLRGGAMPATVPWPADWPLQVPRIAGLAGYSDIEALRLLTEGAIKRNGSQARAPMPRFRMTPSDAADVIAFLRTQ
jgi:mono/diheme cytochrome c family protein